MYLKNKFPRISDAKIKEWLFDHQTDVHQGSLVIMQNVTTNFLGS
jgi:hypothetical protein